MFKNNRYTNNFNDHLFLSFKCLQQKAKERKVKCLSWKSFQKWSLSGKEYKEFYNLWKDSNFYKFAVPFVSDIDPKKGFVLGNLK